MGGDEKEENELYASISYKISLAEHHSGDSYKKLPGQGWSNTPILVRICAKKYRLSVGDVLTQRDDRTKRRSEASGHDEGRAQDL